MLDLFSLLPLSAARDKEGCLTIAGHSLRKLAEQFGTPLYLYDEMTFTSQVSRLHSALKQYYQGNSQVTYAAKAYLSLAFGRHLVEKGLGIEVASLGEMALARRAGFPAKQIHLHGNNKTAAELAASLEYGLYTIVVDSLDELDLLEALANESKSCAPIWLRISPDVQVDTHSFLQTAHASSKFGFRIQDGQAGEAIERAKASRWLQLTGFHTHLGSQLHQTEPYRQAIQRMMALAEAHQFIPQEISTGGGWGVPYTTDQAEDDPQPWIQTIAYTVQEECVKREWPLPALVVEPGRWLVARAGVALYTVGAIKTTVDEHRLVAVDGGMADNPRPALYDALYTACLPEHLDAAPRLCCSVVGKFCESGDYLIHEAWLPEVQRGDLLLTAVSGAYQLSMSSNYNLAPRPAVLYLQPGHVEVMQQRERLTEHGWWLGE